MPAAAKHRHGLRKLLGVAALIAAVAALGQAVPAGTVADIKERTAPFGKLCLQGEECGAQESAAPAAPVAMSGSDVYGKFCHTCHNTGLNDAPKIGDAEAWAPRLAKGAETLLQTTKQGLNLMPAMGLCMSCADGELIAAIDYMTATEGGAEAP